MGGEEQEETAEHEGGWVGWYGEPDWGGYWRFGAFSCFIFCGGILLSCMVNNGFLPGIVSDTYNQTKGFIWN